MNIKLMKKISIIILLAFSISIFSNCVIFAQSEPNIMNPVDNMLNYDSKTRAGKIIYNDIKNDRKNGNKIDWGKIKKDVINKPIMVHFGFDMGLTAVGTIAQFALVSVPGGVVGGTIISSLLAGVGGALGYEYSKNIENGTSDSFRNTVSTSLKKIDAAMLFNKTALGIAGAVIGTMVCPGFGTFIGAQLGSFAGALITPKIRNTALGKTVYDKIQTGWNKIADLFKDKKKSVSKNNVTISSGNNTKPNSIRREKVTGKDSAKIRQQIQSLNMRASSLFNQGKTLDAQKIMQNIKSLRLKLGN